MTESEFQLLREGDHLQFDHSPGRHGIYTGENTTRAGQIYIKIKEALEEGFHRISLISKVSQNQTISDYISKFEFSEPITIRQHLVYQKLCGRLAEVIYSMEATNTEFKAYQYKPVLKLLESPGKGILIADEVGLGKTIEAGLIWTELRARFNCNKLIVVCPANLRKKWVLELFERFDCDARECNGPKELFEVLDSSKKRETGFALVCSYQTFLPPGKNDKSPHRQNLHDLIEKLSIGESLVDLLVIDEAHYVRNRDTKTNQAIRFFNEICNNLVLLSATPVHLGNDNLFSLLNLVDEDTFYDTSLFQQMVYGNEPIIKALRSYPPGKDNIEELKKHLQRAIQTSFFRNNEHLKVALKLANEEMDWSKPSTRELILGPIEKANLFNQYIVRNRKRDVEKERVIREVTDFNIIPSEEELELYENVISATISYAQKKKMDTPGFLLSMPERQFASCIPGTLERWQTISKENDYVLDEGENGEEGQIISSKKIGPLTSHLINSILPKLNISWFRNNDSKFLNLLNVVNDYFRNNDAKKIIIFSTFKSTLSYLEERFHENSIETSLISGDFSPEERWEILQNFENETKIKILLSSEVGSEGLDLQFCSALVNYDLPWNPMKIEQRIGRIDRIGQNEKTIKIFNLSVKKTIDEIIHNRLWKRIEIFESILGDVELILQNKINHLTKELYSHELTFEQKVELVEQTAAALERTIKNEKDLEEQSSDLVAFYDIINQKIENSRTAGRWISSSDIEFLFKDFFKTRFQPPSELIAVNANERTYEIKLSREASFEFSSFLQVNPGLLQQPSKFSHDKFGHFKFTNRPSRKGSLEKLECIDQFHPIIRFAVNEFKDSSHKIHPLSSCTADKNSVFVKPFKFTEINWAFFYVERWTFEVITTIEKLNFVLISDDGKIHEGLEVEKLLNFLSEEANFERYPAVETETIEKAFETAKTFSKEIFERNELEIINDEVQKAKFQKTALERNLKSKVEQLKQKINEKNFKNPQRGISRAEKDIEKAKDNFYEQMNKIEKKMENFNSSFDEVCAGIITFS